MSVTIQEEAVKQGLHKIALTGTLDAPGTMTIEDNFRERLQGLGGRIIVDLSGVDYMSSYGLRMFLVAAKTLRSQGGELHLAAPNENVMQIIRVAGYDTMFPVYSTVEEAILNLPGS